MGTARRERCPANQGRFFVIIKLHQGDVVFGCRVDRFASLVAGCGELQSHQLKNDAEGTNTYYTETLEHYSIVKLCFHSVLILS